jgi:A/G-specific adenine glycosylase
MLQQTRVETVIPYYKEWMNRFPTLDVLASAREVEVLRAWQGLGYYSRARNLHGAARMIRETMGGQLPTSSSELRALPGVGEYTAGAVASIAFGEVVPAVDGNVRRVLSRLFDLPDPGSSELRVLAGALVDPLRPGDFNQALMEMGALVCTPGAPRCEACSLETLCLARLRGTEAERPSKKGKRPVPETEIAVVVAVFGTDADARFLLRRRPEGGLLGGMWEFPAGELGPGEAPAHRAAELAGELGLAAETKGSGLEVNRPSRRTDPEVEGGGTGSHPVHIPLEPVSHAFTHLKARYNPFLVRVPTISNPIPPNRWLSLREIDGVPLPVAQGRILSSARKAMRE